MVVNTCSATAALQILLSCSDMQNELAILEFIHCLVETLDRHFGNVCELDLMFNMEIVRYNLKMSISSVQKMATNEFLLLV